MFLPWLKRRGFSVDVGLRFLIAACFLSKTTPKAPRGKPAGVNILLPLLLLGGGRI